MFPYNYKDINGKEFYCRIFAKKYGVTKFNRDVKF